MSKQGENLVLTEKQYVSKQDLQLYNLQKTTPKQVQTKLGSEEPE